MKLKIEPDFDSENTIEIVCNEIQIILDVEFVAFCRAVIKINGVEVGQITGENVFEKK